MRPDRKVAFGILGAPALVLCLSSCGSAPSGRTPAGRTPEKTVLAESSVTAPAPEAPPKTDIYLVDFDAEVVPWRLVDTQRVTDRDGYDNQPLFEENGESLLFVSMRDGQTDIFRYRPEVTGFEQLTTTPESEYSPTPAPGWPGFSTVRVEADQTQRLWRFPNSPGEGRGAELLFEAIAPVGYHAWIDEETVAMFILGEPNRLVVGNLATQESRVLATDIGRALHPVPGKRAVSFVDKTDPEHWRIAIVDLATGAKRRLAETPIESEDFIWWGPRELLIGDGAKLYVFDLDGAQYWREVADLSESGIEGITRLSRSPTASRLAVVGARAAE